MKMQEIATNDRGRGDGDNGTVIPVTDRDHVYGSFDAPITLVEYAEFECPVCGRAYFQLKALRDRLDELSARLIFRHFARDEIHPYSVRAAVTAEAAARQDRFWEMHDQLFAHQHSLEYEDLKRHAIAVGLDLERFLEDLRDPHLVEIVDAHRAGAIRAGVTSTPTFFLNGRRYDGAYDFDSLVGAITRERERTEARA
jgi:protein-disulfide isomerase